MLVARDVEVVARSGNDVLVRGRFAAGDMVVTTRLPAMLNPPIGFAHRGARAHARENTLEAFSLAIRLGATGLETDVWRTADDEIVCDHDGVVRRLPFSRTPISEVRRADLPEHIPTLAEVYASCGIELPLSLDLKDPDAFEGMLAVAREHRAAEQLWVCHEDLDLLIRWRSLAPEVNLRQRQLDVGLLSDADERG